MARNNKKRKFKYIIVRTEELSWFYEDNEMEKVMASVLGAINKNSISMSLKFPRKFYDFAGLDDFDGWEGVSDYGLVGTRNSEEKWPKEHFPHKLYQKTTLEPQKKWWHFWS